VFSGFFQIEKLNICCACLFSPVISLHQKQFITIQRQIAVLITKVIALIVFSLVDAGKIIEIKPFDEHFFAGGFCFAGWVQFLHNAAVAAQYVVDVADQIITAAVELVVIIIAAHIITEFFICTPVDDLAAIQTMFFGIHKANIGK